MSGFFLMLGHLLGDYILQNDWMAKNKVNPLAGRFPNWDVETDPMDREAFALALGIRNKKQAEYPAKRRAMWIGHLACIVHCLLYTLAVWACSFWWMPWWGLVVVFAAHWPIDRFRLARLWMVHVSGQEEFATGPLAPWSVIIVDNIFHLLTLGLIAAGAGVAA